MKLPALFFLAFRLAAQVQPAPGWCSMAHCNSQMTDFVPLTPIGLGSSVWVMNEDKARAGVKFGLACVSNGTNFACSYNQSLDALVYYDADGNVLWTSGNWLDANTYIAAPLIQADGSVVIGDDQHVIKFNSNGSVAWATRTPGGQPTSLVTTPNGAIVAATAQVAANPCSQNNCQLAVTVNAPGAQYSNASVSFAGGDCPGATATATVSGGQITAITVSSQGSACIVPPDVIIAGDGSGADASALLYSPTPVAVYSGITGALVGSTILYASGSSGPSYLTTNTPCVNNGSFPNRIYISTSLYGNAVTGQNQGALWAVDIDPTNPMAAARPAWNIVYGGPSGASPLCVGDSIYFDGAGFTPGDQAGTTIFGAHDSGGSGSLMFHESLGPGAGAVTTNFALDPRPAGGFWHQLQGNPNLYHRDATTGALLEQIATTPPLLAMGAPPGLYWDAGSFTTYGTADHPYFIVSELAPPVASYLTMFDITDGALVWALPIYPGNSPFLGDTAEGMAAMAVDAQGRSVVAIPSRYNGAYFIANGPAALTLSTASLSFGNEVVGANSAAEAIAVTNTGSAPVSITNIAASGDFAQTNNCVNPLPAGIRCTLTVTFMPATSGVRSGAVSISSDAAGSPQTVTLSGTGISGQPGINLSPATLSFAPQPAGTTSRAQTVTVTNNGTAPLAISGIAASGDSIESNGCPASLAPGANCLIYVMFRPSGTGRRAGLVTITTNASGSPQQVAVAGSGTTTPTSAAGLSSTRLVFPPQMAGTISTPQTVTVSNAGSAVLSIGGITATGSFAQTNTCGSSLGVGASCSVTITFTPVTTGLLGGTVTITDNGAGSPQMIVVSGTGTGIAVPLLNEPLTPASQVAGAAGFTLTVRGGPFVSGAVVDWNGAPLVTSLISSTELSAAVPASAVAAAGTARINAANPGPGGGVSNTAWFPITRPSSSLFFSLNNVSAGAGVQALATADFNNDGRLDLVTANTGANTISVLLGKGNGTFAAAVNYAAGAAPVAVAAGDFNRDGKLDLAVANQADNTVSIFLGAGNGRFTASKAYATGSGPLALAVADFNGDGNLDIAVANGAGNSVTILTGAGNGTFGNRVDYGAGQAPSALAAGDFNADGHIDLAVANDFAGGTVSVLLGSAGGTFAPAVPYVTGDSVALMAADLNGDGILDLAAVNREEQTLSVLLGNGDGTFQAAETAPLTCPPNLGVSGGVNTCELDPGPVSLAVGALNGDGSLALAIVNGNAGSISILPGDGNGVFRKTSDYATAAGPVAVVTGDFNGDGSLDLAVAAAGSNSVSVLLQSPDVILSATKVSFGSVMIGQSASQTVTLSNAGSAPLSLFSMSVSGDFSQTNTCGSTLAAGAYCSITITFTPTAAGPVTGMLVIADNAPGTPQRLALSGTGLAATQPSLQVQRAGT